MTTLYALILGTTLALLPCIANAEIKIRSLPAGVSINGGAVPTEASFVPPLGPGQSAVIDADGVEALRVEVVEGEVSRLSSRVKLPANGSITYKRITNGSVEESSSIAVLVKDGIRPNGPGSLVTKSSQDFREQAKAGSYRLLVYTENGMRSLVLLQDANFRTRITGSSALSNSLYLGVEGSFSEKVTSEFSAP